MRTKFKDSDLPKKFRLFFLLSLLSAAMVLSQCTGIKTAGSGKVSKGLYTDFYVGEEGTQYFIKPLVFESEDGSRVEMDFTFRYLDSVKGDARLNASLFTADVIKNIDSVAFAHPQFRTNSKSTELIFVERKKNSIESRHGILISIADLQKLFENPDWTLTFFYSEKQMVFKSSKQTEKKITALRHDIFSLL